MPSDQSQFDPYHKWFGIPREEQPPDHYRLLRIQRFESDPDVIDNAYNTAMRELKSREQESAEWVERISRQLVTARQCLLDEAKKATYDETLRAKSQELVVQPPPRPQMSPIGGSSDSSAEVAVSQPAGVDHVAPGKPVQQHMRRKQVGSEEYTRKQRLLTWVTWSSVAFGALVILVLLLLVLNSQKDTGSGFARKWNDLTKYPFAAEQHWGNTFAVNRPLPNIGSNAGVVFPLITRNSRSHKFIFTHPLKDGRSARIVYKFDKPVFGFQAGLAVVHPKGHVDAKVFADGQLATEVLDIHGSAQKKTIKFTSNKPIHQLTLEVDPRDHFGFDFFIFDNPEILVGAFSSPDPNAIAGDGQVRQLGGHIAGVNSLQFSSDGNSLLSASSDQTARIWNVHESTSLSIGKTEGRIHRASFTPNEKHILTAHSKPSNCAILWESSTGKEVQRFGTHDDGVADAAVSSDGRYVVTSSFDKTIRLWEANTGREVQRFQGHQDAAIRLQFIPGRNQFVSAGRDGTVMLWNLDSEKPIRQFEGQRAGTMGIAISQDGKSLFSSSEAGLVHQWEVATGKHLLSFAGPAGAIRDLILTPDGRYLIGGCMKRIICVWDLETTIEVYRIQTAAYSTNSIVCSPNGQYLAAAGGWFYDARKRFRKDGDYAVRVWRLPERFPDKPVGDGLAFDGINDYVEAPHIPFDSYEQFTIEAWVMGWRGPMLAQGIGGDPENSVFLQLGNSHSGWEAGKGVNYSYDMARVLPLSWKHLAIVYNGTHQLFFKNGTLLHKQEAPRPQPLIGSRPCLIGAHRNPRSKIFGGPGFIRAIRVSKTARYTKSFSPDKTLAPDAHCVLCYDMSDPRGQDVELKDLSNNSRNGIIHGATWVQVEAQKRRAAAKHK